MLTVSRGQSELDSRPRGSELPSIWGAPCCRHEAHAPLLIGSAGGGRGGGGGGFGASFSLGIRSFSLSGAFFVAQSASPKQNMLQMRAPRNVAFTRPSGASRSVCLHRELAAYFLRILRGRWKSVAPSGAAVKGRCERSRSFRSQTPFRSPPWQPPESSPGPPATTE